MFTASDLGGSHIGVFHLAIDWRPLEWPTLNAKSYKSELLLFVTPIMCFSSPSKVKKRNFVDLLVMKFSWLIRIVSITVFTLNKMRFLSSKECSQTIICFHSSSNHNMHTIDGDWTCWKIKLGSSNDLAFFLDIYRINNWWFIIKFFVNEFDWFERNSNNIKYFSNRVQHKNSLWVHRRWVNKLNILFDFHEKQRIFFKIG